MAGPTAVKGGTRQRDASPVRTPRPPGPGPRLRLPSRRILVVALIAAVVLTGGGSWLLYGSPWLRVERVTTSGTDVLTPHEVKDAAAVPVGAPLISVGTGAIEDRLRRELPRIKSVDVVRSWPHGIGLKVTERKPVLLIEKGGNFVEVDSAGVRFATVPRAPRGVPLLELSAGQSPSLKRFGADRLRREAVKVAGDLPPAIANDTRSVKVRSYDSVVLELKSGRTVDWGSSEKGRAKGATLTALLKAAPKARHFDVSAPTAPAVTGS